MAEPTLTEEQKQTLLHIYLSFRREQDGRLAGRPATVRPGARRRRRRRCRDAGGRRR